MEIKVHRKYEEKVNGKGSAKSFPVSEKNSSMEKIVTKIVHLCVFGSSSEVVVSLNFYERMHCKFLNKKTWTTKP